jgi:hypothetical protein
MKKKVDGTDDGLALPFIPMTNLFIVMPLMEGSKNNLCSYISVADI